MNGSSKFRLLAAAVLGAALLDPYPHASEFAQAVDADALRVARAGALSRSAVGALAAYPHANRSVHAKLLALARALPTVAAGDAATRAAFRTLGAPYLDAVGLAEGDHVLEGARDAFAVALGDRVDAVGVKVALDGWSWLPARGARCRSPVDEQRDRVALRSAMKKATGS